MICPETMRRSEWSAFFHYLQSLCVCETFWFSSYCIVLLVVVILHTSSFVQIWRPGGMLGWREGEYDEEVCEVKSHNFSIASIRHTRRRCIICCCSKICVWFLFAVTRQVRIESDSLNFFKNSNGRICFSLKRASSSWSRILSFVRFMYLTLIYSINYISEYHGNKVLKGITECRATT